MRGPAHAPIHGAGLCMLTVPHCPECGVIVTDSESQLITARRPVAAMIIVMCMPCGAMLVWPWGSVVLGSVPEYLARYLIDTDPHLYAESMKRRVDYNAAYGVHICAECAYDPAGRAPPSGAAPGLSGDHPWDSPTPPVSAFPCMRVIEPRRAFPPLRAVPAARTPLGIVRGTGGTAGPPQPRRES